jgi:hypothetical protein
LVFGFLDSLDDFEAGRALGCRRDAQPIRVSIEFDTGVVDQIIERRTVLRAQMTPGLPPANKRN